MHDVAVIGGGSGGYAAAIRASQLGASVVLVESADLGGTCVNRGCIPSKVWLRAAELQQLIRAGEAFGLTVSDMKTDYRKIVDRKNGVAAEIRMGMEALLQNNGVEVIRGRGSLKGARTIDIEGRAIEAKSIIIATGSSLSGAAKPAEADLCFTTDDLLDMVEPPGSVLVCGAGYIEVEMAGVLSAFGSKVTMVCESGRILPKEDPETSQRISQVLRATGVEILPGSSLQGLNTSQEGASAKIGGKSDLSVTVDKVLLSGRVPNTSNMGLEAVGVELTEDQAIRVDDYLQSSVEGIYAIGDATGGWMLSHMASSMAVFAAENAMGNKRKYPFNLVPRCLWTRPQMAAVGLSEDEAEERGFDVETGSFPFSVNGLAMAYDEVGGSVKVVSDARYGEILGVHIVGTNATEIIGEAVTAMQLEATVQELARSIRVHPTFSEAVVDAARDVGEWALYLPRG